MDRLEKRIANIPQSIWEIISRIDEIKGQWKTGTGLGPQVLGRLKRSALITSTGASTRIEGARLSDEDVEKLMRGVGIQKFADRDAQEVRGYYELLANVFDAWERLSFTEGLMKHFHREMLKYVEKDKLHRGEYKKKENKVVLLDETGKPGAVLFDTAPAYLTPKLMLELAEWTKQTLDASRPHPILAIGNFLIEFLAIHPFEDGNGRLSRILTNFLLLRTGYLYVPYVSHEKLVEERKIDYYLALRRSQKTFGSPGETIEPWLTFFLDVLRVQAEQAAKLISREEIEVLLSPKQRAVLEFLQSVPDASPAEIARAAKVARPTVNQALEQLIGFKVVERLGRGRATRYRVISNNK